MVTLPEGFKTKDDVVFIHRSPLSCVVYGHAEYKDVMKELQEVLLAHVTLTRKNFSLSVIYCWCDSIRQQERLGERLYWADDAQKVFTYRDPFQYSRHF